MPKRRSICAAISLPQATRLSGFPSNRSRRIRKLLHPCKPASPTQHSRPRERRYQTGKTKRDTGSKRGGQWQRVAVAGEHVAGCVRGDRRRFRAGALGQPDFRQSAHNGYGGKIHLINPRQQTVYGERCFPSLRDIGAPVDHAMVIVPATDVADVLTDAEAAGVKSATIYACAVGDGEDPSGKRGAWLKGFLAGSKLRLAGPNCMGSHSYRERLFAYPNTNCAGPARLRRLNFQSGGTMQFWLRTAPIAACAFPTGYRRATRPISISPIISNFLVDDPHTHRSYCSSKASGGLQLSCTPPDARCRPASRCWRSKPAPRRNRERRRGRTPAPSAATTRPIWRCANATASAIAARSTTGGMHARLPVRPSAEGPKDRFRHHFGRHGRSALRLCRDRRRDHAGIQRRHQCRADAAHAGRNRAEKPARRRHSFDAQGGRRPVCDRGAGRTSTWSPGRRRCRARAASGTASGASPAVERDRQAGAGVRPHDPSDDAGRARYPGQGRLSVPARSRADAARHQRTVVFCSARRAARRPSSSPAPPSDLTPANLDATLARYGITPPQSRAVTMPRRRPAPRQRSDFRWR